MAGRRITAFLSTVLTLCALAAPARGADGAQTPSVEELMERLGYNAEDKKAFQAEKIVATDIERARGDQLIASVAVYLPVKIEDLAKNLRQGLNIARDPGVIAFGELNEGAASGQLDRIGFGADETNEVKRLIRVKPGDTFNLSSEEIEALRAELDGVSPDDTAAAEAVSAAYRDVLDGRVRTYLAKGLQGMPPYDHGKKSFSPADGPAAVYKQSEGFLSEYFPAFNKVLAGFPKNQDPEISSQIYWIKRRVEGRPAFVLAHQLVDAGPNHVLLGHRQFFVGHTYDSLQVIALALPHRDGAAVFYVNAAFTDKVTGFFSGVAHSVGQSRMREDLTTYFENVRAQTGE